MAWVSVFLSVSLSVSSAALDSSETRQFFLREPDNQTAIEGQQVTLNYMNIIFYQKDINNFILKIILFDMGFQVLRNKFWVFFREALIAPPPSPNLFQ